MNILPGIQLKTLLAPETTNGQVAVFEETTSPGFGPPLHTHENQIEVFHVRQGTYAFQIGDDITTAREGDCLAVPAGVPHAFRNVGEAEGKLVFELFPGAGADQFFAELAQIDNPENIPALFEKFNWKLLGPSRLQ